MPVFQVNIKKEKLGMPVDLVQEHLLDNFVREGIGSEREVVYEKAQ